MIERSTDGKQRVLSLSYGKDSLACLGAIEQLGLPLDRIVHAEVWATDTIPADLPPMVEFKAKSDAIIKERWGFEVEHYRSKNTYQSIFYKTVGERSVKQREERKQIAAAKGKPLESEMLYGFPLQRGAWCNSKLKLDAIRLATKSCAKSCVSYIGIATDEAKRLERLDGISKISPLALIGWTEATAKQWCIENDLLSPIYTTSARGGCWFCHNQGIGQLRLLRKTYPEL